MPGLLLAILVLAALGRPVSPAVGAAPPPAITAEIRLGFDGYVVPDVWIPVALRLRSEHDLAATVEVVTSRSRPPTTERVRQEVHLRAGIPHPVTLPVVVRDVQARVTVRLLEGEAVLAEWPVVVPPTRFVDAVVLALTRQPAGLQPLVGEDARVAVAYVREEDLPAHWGEYEGVAAVVVRDLEDHRMLPAQVQALERWIASGGRLFLAAPLASDLPSRAALRPFLSSGVASAKVPGGPERVYRWGRGEVIMLPSDPFRPDLPPDAAASWIRLLRAPPPPPLVDRTLRDVLPETRGLGVRLQVLVVLALGGYLALLGPLLRWLQRGRAGILLAVSLLGAMTLVTAVLNAAVRRSISTPLVATVAQGLPGRNLVLVESTVHLLPPRGGAFQARAAGETLVRAQGARETTLVLGEMVRFTGRTQSALPLRARALLALPIRGAYRERAEGMEVEVHNESGRRLRDALVVFRGRVQSIPPVGREARMTLSPLAWRDPPALEAAAGTAARLRAWAIGRLRNDAILSATASLVAWLDDDRGALLWPDRPVAPQLLVLPLHRAEEAP